MILVLFFFSSRRRHTRYISVTGVQTCALPISSGNPTASKMYRITRVILSQPDIEGYVFVTPLSSQQLDNTARGIVKAVKEIYPDGQPNIPCVLCFRGAWDETALAMFEQHGIARSPLVR